MQKTRTTTRATRGHEEHVSCDPNNNNSNSNSSKNEYINVNDDAISSNNNNNTATTIHRAVSCPALRQGLDVGSGSSLPTPPESSTSFRTVTTTSTSVSTLDESQNASVSQRGRVPELDLSFSAGLPTPPQSFRTTAASLSTSPLTQPLVQEPSTNLSQTQRKPQRLPEQDVSLEEPNISTPQLVRDAPTPQNLPTNRDFEKTHHQSSSSFLSSSSLWTISARSRRSASGPDSSTSLSEKGVTSSSLALQCSSRGKSRQSQQQQPENLKTGGSFSKIPPRDSSSATLSSSSKDTLIPSRRSSSRRSDDSSWIGRRPRQRLMGEGDNDDCEDEGENDDDERGQSPNRQQNSNSFEGRLRRRPQEGNEHEDNHENLREVYVYDDHLEEEKEAEITLQNDDDSLLWGSQRNLILSANPVAPPVYAELVHSPAPSERFSRGSRIDGGPILAVPSYDDDTTANSNSVRHSGVISRGDDDNENEEEEEKKKKQQRQHRRYILILFGSCVGFLLVLSFIVGVMLVDDDNGMPQDPAKGGDIDSDLRTTSPTSPPSTASPTSSAPSSPAPTLKAPSSSSPSPSPSPSVLEDEMTSFPFSPSVLDLNLEARKDIIGNAILSLLPLSSSTALYRSNTSALWEAPPGSAQFCALQWLQTTNYPITSVTSLVESYALLVLHYAQTQTHMDLTCREMTDENNFLGISPTLDVCSWNKTVVGMKTCDDAGGRQMIRFHFGDVHGDLPIELVLLQSLSLVIAAQNFELHGFPWDALEKWPRLESIDVERNGLQGTFPAHLFTSDSNRTLILHRLNVQHNQLSGTFPHIISPKGRLRNLEYFSAYDQRSFGGTLPSTMDTLKNLIWFQMHNNEMGGRLPSQLGNLHSLVAMGLSQNFFSGTLPTELGKMKSIEYLRASDNLLTGTIPTELGECRELGTLELARNALQGRIPTEVLRPLSARKSRLEFLDLSSNLLTGTIPTELALLPRLGRLDLSHNELQGTVPMGLATMRKLRTLRLTKISGLSGSMKDFCAVKSETLTVVVDCVSENDKVPVLECACCDCE